MVEAFIPQDLSRSNSQNLNSLTRQPCIATLIMFELHFAVVSRSIDFKGDTRCGAEEVENIWSDRMLASELQPS